MKRNIIRAAIVLAIIGTVFTVVALVLPVPKNLNVYLALLFGWLAIGFQGYTLYSGYATGRDERSRFYGFPIARVGTVYMVTQLAVSLVCVVRAYYIPWWVVAIVCLLALAAASIGIISAEAMRDEIQRQDAKLKVEVYNIRSLQSKVRALASQCTQGDCGKAIAKLSDELSYSDPVSAEGIAATEAELLSQVDELQKAVLDGDLEAAERLAKKASATLAERNRLCKLNK